MPKAMPVRSGSAAPGFKAASARANWATATPIWHSRHITFSPLRIAFFCSFSSGPKSSISPVNCRASAPNGRQTVRRRLRKKHYAAASLREPFPESLLGASQRANSSRSR